MEAYLESRDAGRVATPLPHLRYLKRPLPNPSTHRRTPPTDRPARRRAALFVRAVFRDRWRRLEASPDRLRRGPESRTGLCSTLCPPSARCALRAANALVRLDRKSVV